MTPHPSRAAPLRADVALEQHAEGYTLRDPQTGFSAELGAVEGFAVSQLRGAPDLDAVAQTLAHNDPSLDAAAIKEELSGFWQTLSTLGLLDEGLLPADIRRRQNAQLLSASEPAHLTHLARALDGAERAPFLAPRLQPTHGQEPLDRLAAAPPMTKAELRSEFPHGLVPDAPEIKDAIEAGALTLSATSGTTDERLEVLFDWKQGALPDNYPALWNLDAPSLVRGAVFTTPICAGFECTLGVKTMAERVRGVTLTLNSVPNLFALGEADVRSFVEDVAAFDPQLLFANGAYLTVLIRRAEALGIPLPSFKAVLASYQFITQQERRLITRALRSPVFSYYGASDLGGALIGAECTEGRLHERSDLIYLELLDGKHQRVAPGALGRVSVTTLRSPHLPLVRYQVGDLARWYPDACSCKAGGESRTFRYEGRTKDLMTKTTGELVTFADLDAAFGPVTTVDLYRVVQTAPRRYEIELIASPGASEPQLHEEMISCARKLFGVDAEVTSKTVRRLPQERSLKLRLGHSTVTPGPAAP